MVAPDALWERRNEWITAWPAKQTDVRTVETQPKKANKRRDGKPRMTEWKSN